MQDGIIIVVKNTGILGLSCYIN